MNTTDTAKAIRKQLRTELGATSRHVSVRCDQYSMGATIHVTIKVSWLSLTDVERIARGHEQVARCEITGDILCGGNTHVSAKYSSDATEVTETMVRQALEGGLPGEIVTFGEMAVWSCTQELETWRAQDAAGNGHAYFGLHGAVRCVAIAILCGEAG